MRTKAATNWGAVTLALWLRPDAHKSSRCSRHSGVRAPELEWKNYQGRCLTREFSVLFVFFLSLNERFLAPMTVYTNNNNNHFSPGGFRNLCLGVTGFSCALCLLRPPRSHGLWSVPSSRGEQAGTFCFFHNFPGDSDAIQAPLWVPLIILGLNKNWLPPNEQKNKAQTQMGGCNASHYGGQIRVGVRN